MNQSVGNDGAHQVEEFMCQDGVPIRTTEVTLAAVSKFNRSTCIKLNCSLLNTDSH